MDYERALAWLYGTQGIGVKLGLGNTRRLQEAWEIETAGATVYHVAGTNGKGSVCAFLESMLRRAGRKTGLMTSPHLIAFPERIRVNFEPADEKVLARLISDLRRLVENWDPHPTFFELTTALALRHFQEEEVDDLILETGMGGRLDSTNAVPSDISLVTSIDFDHEKALGDTLEKIAREKAGILKAGVPAVIPGSLPPEAASVIERRAAELSSPLHRVREPLPAGTALGLKGVHQRWNAALAQRAVVVRNPEVPARTIREGLAGTYWPARFQEVRRGADTVVIDGAHNPAAARELAATWKAEFGEKRATLVFGTVEDKECRDVLDALRPIVGEIWLTSTPTARGIPAKDLAEGLGPGAWDRVVDDVADALQPCSAGRLFLVAGSLFLAGKALEVLSPEGAAFEASLQ